MVLSKLLVHLLAQVTLCIAVQYRMTQTLCKRPISCESLAQCIVHLNNSDVRSEVMRTGEVCSRVCAGTGSIHHQLVSQGISLRTKGTQTLVQGEVPVQSTHNLVVHIQHVRG